MNMTKCPKVSIIIPAYNVENYIVKGLEACKNQTYKNIEVIIVDDGSSDDTASVVHNYIIDDERFIFIEKENGGVSSARNVALKEVTGEYVIFLDSDDWLELDAVETLINAKMKNPDSFIICSRYIVDERDLSQKYNDDLRNQPEYCNIIDALKKYDYKFFYFQSSCYKLFDRKIIDNNKLFFSEHISHGEDGLFVYEYLQFIEGIFSIPIPLWNILDRASSATNLPFNEKKLSAVQATETMMALTKHPAIKQVIFKYRVTRIESMLIEAVRGKDNSKAIKFLRKKLRKNKRILFTANNSIKEKIRWFVMAYFPITILQILINRE